MKAVKSVFFSVITCCILHAQNTATSQNVKWSSQRLVVVGDSLSAGVQNFSLLDSQQPHGYAKVVADQAGWPLFLPLVPYPGAPNVLYVKTLTPFVDIEEVSGTLPFPPRDNPWVEPTDIAVPGMTVSSALTLRPSFAPNTPVEQQWATIVLGFPNLPFWAPTEMELAEVLHPTLTIEWLGNNDALVPVLAGQISALTPQTTFTTSYAEVLDRLARTGTKIVTATIPDVTEIPFFTSGAQIAASAKISDAEMTALLGIQPDDYVRPGAQEYIYLLLTQQKTGSLTNATCGTLPGLGSQPLPCVLTAADAKIARAQVNCYNQIITAQTALHGGVVVDINKLVNDIYIQGYQLGDGTTLTANFFGGLFSLDGIHPTNAGYAVIANKFIRTMNNQMGMTIPPADVSSIFSSDPLNVYYQPSTPVGQAPPPAGKTCTY